MFKMRDKAIFHVITVKYINLIFFLYKTNFKKDFKKHVKLISC
jgi:hypothetical protein